MSAITEDGLCNPGDLIELLKQFMAHATERLPAALIQATRLVQRVAHSGTNGNANVLFLPLFLLGGDSPTLSATVF